MEEKIMKRKRSCGKGGLEKEQVLWWRRSSGGGGSVVVEVQRRSRFSIEEGPEEEGDEEEELRPHRLWMKKCEHLEPCGQRHTCPARAL